MIFTFLRKFFVDKDFNKLLKEKKGYKNNYVTILKLYNKLVK